ncbi:MAG: rRNA pseudouridine synthase [Clostridia bacterium]|nr:rRNA pseudouridine synthase [Clostridia bacterium]
MKNEAVRLQKYLSDCGIASRRKAEEMIIDGQVKVNGKKVELGTKIVPEKDIVTVNGKKVQQNDEKVYIMLHKPRGYITTMSDERDRKCVAQLVKDVGARVYPVGRLDRESEGLLLFTNDGEFANAITHPAKHIPKTYRVTIRPSITEEDITKLQLGIELDGRMTAPAEVLVIEKQEGRVVLEVTIYEGRNRQIRRMFESLDIEVARLKRISIGGVKLGMLQIGSWRNLDEREVRRLISATKGKNKSANN